MEYVIRFAISLFDLAVFMYYFHSNKKMKPVSKVWIWAGFTIAAIIWTFVSNIKDGEIQTSKKYEMDEHGVGIKNIIEVITKYQGSYAIRNDNNEFYFSVILPN